MRQIEMTQETMNDVEIFAAVLEALSSKELSKGKMASVFRRAMLGQFRKDSGTLHNLGVLAAKAGLKKEALAFALDHFEEPQFYSAYLMSRTYLESNDVVNDGEFETLLSQLAEAGHIETLKYIFQRRFRKFGYLSTIFSLAHSFWLLPRVFRIARKDVNDPRLDRRPAMRTRS